MKDAYLRKQKYWLVSGLAAVGVSGLLLMIEMTLQAEGQMSFLLAGTAFAILTICLLAFSYFLSLQSKQLFEALDERDYADYAAQKLASHKTCIDAHAIVSITDASGCITYANDKFCELSKYSRDELIGQDHRLLNSGLHEEDFFEGLYRAIERGETWSAKMRNRAKDGCHYWVSSTVTPILSDNGELEELISIHTDITAIKKNEQELLRINQILNSVFENFPGSIAVYDKDLFLQMANPAFYELLSVPADRYPVGSHLEDLLRYNAEIGHYGEGNVDTLVEDRMVIARKKEPYNFTRTTMEGRVLEVRGWPLESGGFLTTHLDITERHRMIHDLQLKNEEAQQTAEKLRFAQREQVRSHEHLLNSINSMQNGFAIWGDQGKLILANNAFRDYHAPVAHLIKPGLMLDKLLSACYDFGLWVSYDGRSEDLSGNKEDWVAARVKDYRAPNDAEATMTLRNGKQLVMNKRRLSNGNTISTLIDVTAQQEREEELRRTRDALEHIAYFDALTTLPNRAHGQHDLEAMFRRTEDNPNFAIIQIDLDKFKRVNDTMGHAAGDHLLKVVGSRLSFLSNKVPAFKPYRWGGDEFIALMTFDDQRELESLCQELTDLIAVPVPYEKITLWPTVSIGIALYPDDANSLEALMIYADLALYKTKQMGRDGYHFFTAEMKERVGGDIQIEHDIRSALEEDQFELYFQPQVNSCDESITGLEALVRWNHPERGQLPPALFMDVVENNGLASALGRTIIDKAMQAARYWMDEGLDFGRLAINLSPNHIQKATLVDDFLESMDRHGVQPNLLAVELLESLLFEDAKTNVDEIFDRLASAGVHVELDDFGTGYAGLSHLSNLPVDGIKIDRSFIQTVSHDEKQRAILEVVMSMSKMMKLRVVCEGVETYSQLETVRKIANCSVQGYLVSRPLRFDQVTHWIRERRNIGSMKPPSPRPRHETNLHKIHNAHNP